MADQAAAPFVNPATGEQIGWAQIVDGHVVVTSLDNEAILAGATPDGRVVDGTYFEWNTDPDNLHERLTAAEEQLAVLDYEPEPEPEPEEAFDDNDMWAEQFQGELERYQNEHGRAVTDRELHDLMSSHYRRWQQDPESTTIWGAALEVRTPDLDTHQGRVDHEGERLEDADRERRGVEYDPRGERAATEYDRDTREGRVNFALDRMAGFIDADGGELS